MQLDYRATQEVSIYYLFKSKDFHIQLLKKNDPVKEFNFRIFVILYLKDF